MYGDKMKHKNYIMYVTKIHGLEGFVYISWKGKLGKILRYPMVELHNKMPQTFGKSGYYPWTVMGL